jgi:hypothetical protein
MSVLPRSGAGSNRPGYLKDLSLCQGAVGSQADLEGEYQNLSGSGIHGSFLNSTRAGQSQFAVCIGTVEAILFSMCRYQTIMIS